MIAEEIHAEGAMAEKCARLEAFNNQYLLFTLEPISLPGFALCSTIVDFGIFRLTKSDLAIDNQSVADWNPLIIMIWIHRLDTLPRLLRPTLRTASSQIPLKDICTHSKHARFSEMCECQAKQSQIGLEAYWKSEHHRPQFSSLRKLHWTRQHVHSAEIRKREWSHRTEGNKASRWVSLLY